MSPLSYALDTFLGFAVAGIAGPLLTVDGGIPEITLKDIMSYGVGGAVIVVVWLFLQHLRNERSEQAAERKSTADLLAKEREQASIERQHGMDRVNEITGMFSKTVLEIVNKK